MSCCRKKKEVAVEKSGDENVERGNWVGKLDFLMSCISYAVGLGNIWRFPYLCYRNGGGAFLIPYLTFLFLCGMPLFFLEVSYGQFSSLSPITVWRISPLFKGVGYGMVIISAVVCVYYNIIITWTIYYLVMSLRAVLPWSTCNNPWNTDLCALHVGAVNKSNLDNETILELGSKVIDGLGNLTNLSIRRRSPSEEYWENHVLDISDGIENVGVVRWQLLICLAVAWILVFLCLIRGVKSSGKVVYFTATFPYVALLILLVRGLTLPGAIEGIKFYLIPRWHKLLTLKVWGEAAMQIFYSIGAAWGALITMASFNKFNHDCYKDALIVPLLNSGTSIFNGFVIFSIIGFMAQETGSEIEEVVTQGPGLVFVVYPEAVSKMPISPLWSVLFFLMLLSVGLGSQFGMVQTLISAFVDEFPKLQNHKLKVTIVGCIVEFLIGIFCITQGGIYVLQIMDWYSSTFSLMIISLTECLVISWIYGLERFYKDIELMIGYRPCLWWKAVWGFITPTIIAFVLGFSIIIHTPVTYGDYEYPGWAIGIGWIFALCSLIPLPVCAIYAISKEKGPIKERIKKLIKPSPDFGPALSQYRVLYENSRQQRRGTEDPVVTDSLMETKMNSISH